MQSKEDFEEHERPGEPLVPPPEPVRPPPAPPVPPIKARNGDESAAKSPASGLQEKLAMVRANAAETQDALLRAKAELDNVRRRAREEIARAQKFSIEGFAETLVPVKDSLEAALRLANPSVDSLKQGVEMTLRQLNAAFAKNSLTEINPEPGDQLDPMKHHAISMVPATQAGGAAVAANTIINVLQKGYMITDRLLRPALVMVAERQSGKETALEK